MRNLLVGLVTVCLVAIAARGARADYGFTFTTDDTLEWGPQGTMLLMYATLTNTGTLSDTYDVWGEATNLPDNWFAQFCDTMTCYFITEPPTVKQYELEPGVSYPFEIKLMKTAEGPDHAMITMFARSHGDTTLVGSVNFHGWSPVDVYLTHLDVVPGVGTVSLGWRVSSEDVAGFHVHRATGNGSYECVTDDMVRPDRSRGGSFSDTGLRNGRRYSYLIEAVTVSGDSEFLGPFNAVPGQSLSWGVLKAAYR